MHLNRQHHRRLEGLVFAMWKWPIMCRRVEHSLIHSSISVSSTKSYVAAESIFT